MKERKKERIVICCKIVHAPQEYGKKKKIGDALKIKDEEKKKRTSKNLNFPTTTTTTIQVTLNNWCYQLREKKKKNLGKFFFNTTKILFL